MPTIKVFCDQCGSRSFDINLSYFESIEDWINNASEEDVDTWRSVDEISNGASTDMDYKTFLVCSDECEDALFDRLRKKCSKGKGIDGCKGELCVCEECYEFFCEGHLTEVKGELICSECQKKKPEDIKEHVKIGLDSFRRYLEMLEKIESQPDGVLVRQAIDSQFVFSRPYGTPGFSVYPESIEKYWMHIAETHEVIDFWHWFFRTMET